MNGGGAILLDLGGLLKLTSEKGSVFAAGGAPWNNAGDVVFGCSSFDADDEGTIKVGWTPKESSSLKLLTPGPKSGLACFFDMMQ